VADEEIHAKLIVPDTGPLITLAAADSLDYLLYPGAPIYVPDAVLYESTIKGDALGAESIAEWVQQHSQQVFPMVTQIFANHMAMLDAGLKAPRDLGERAAIEAIRHALVLAKDERAIFITEDDRLLTGTYVVLGSDRDRMIPITTWDFLHGLEEAQRINSADDVYRRAEDAGRLASRRAVLAADHERAIAAVKDLLRRDRDDPDPAPDRRR
jgi:hypothetical protein